MSVNPKIQAMLDKARANLEASKAKDYKLSQSLLSQNKLVAVETTKEDLVSALTSAIDSITNVDLAEESTILASQVKTLTLNERQSAFVSLGASGRSCCLIGAAGTGKTTAVVTLVEELCSNGLTPQILLNTGSPSTPRLRQGLKGIAGVAFTRRAVANLKKNMPAYLHPHAMTLHGLLEFSPVDDDFITEEGEIVTKRTFEPLRNAGNLLPSQLHTIIIDESSMVGIDLFKLLMDAIAHKVQIIFIGDLNQLPPVFGDAILGYALLALPTIQLTEVYRQALESPIIRLAHRILSGKPITYAELSNKDPEVKQSEHSQVWQIENKMKIGCWKAGTCEETAEHTAVSYLESLYKLGKYNPYSDMVIIPFNKAFGTISLAKGIASFLDKEHNIHPLEIVSGYNKVYFAVGDLVLYKNDEYVIKKIVPNKMFRGMLPNNDYIYDRRGNALAKKSTTNYGEQMAVAMDVLMETMVLSADSETTDEASHVITLIPVVIGGDDFEEGSKKFKETDNNLQHSGELVISTRGAVNSMALAYSTTCHKAQGLEAVRVFILLHKSHNVSLNREWLYTAITRAKEELVVLCERDSFIKGINVQKIKGRTLEEKANHFKGKIDGKNEVVNKSNPVGLLELLA